MYPRVVSGTVLVAVMAAFNWSSGAEQKDKDKDAVRQIDVKNLTLPKPKTNTKPEALEITSAEQLSQALPGEETQAKIKGQVDFSKEKLVYFGWNAAPDSKITFRVEKSDKGLLVSFVYDFGFSMRLVDQHLLFAIPRDASCKLLDK